METVVTHVQTEHNLTIVQLATSCLDSFDYIACGGAIAEGLIQLEEMNDGGIVNAIRVSNCSEEYIFLMDGDILSGAKQNRIVNTSVLLAPQSKTKVPVSCVERGRWKSTSPTVTTSEASAPSSIRSEKAHQVSESLKNGRGFASNQGEIWNSVARIQCLFRVESQTSNLSDIFNKKSDQFNQFARHFSPQKGTNGMSVFIGDRLAGIDIFNRQDVFREYFPKLIQAASMEASSPYAPPHPVTDAAARYLTLDMLDRIEALQFEERPGIGVGVDRRYASGEITGFDLEFNSHLIHRAAFTQSNHRNEGPQYNPGIDFPFA